MEQTDQYLPKAYPIIRVAPNSFCRAPFCGDSLKDTFLCHRQNGTFIF